MIMDLDSDLHRSGLRRTDGPSLGRRVRTLWERRPRSQLLSVWIFIAIFGYLFSFGAERFAVFCCGPAPKLDPQNLIVPPPVPLPNQGAGNGNGFDQARFGRIDVPVKDPDPMRGARTLMRFVFVGFGIFVGMYLSTIWEGFGPFDGFLAALRSEGRLR